MLFSYGFYLIGGFNPHWISLENMFYETKGAEGLGPQGVCINIWDSCTGQWGNNYKYNLF